MIRYACVIYLLILMSSCRIGDKRLIKSMVSNSDSTLICDKDSVGKQTNAPFRVPVKLSYNRASGLCYLVLKNSNYPVPDFTFKPDELRTAKVCRDSMFNAYKKFESIETLILIHNKKTDKVIGINLRENYTVKDISRFDTPNGSGSNFDVLEFDEKGLLLERYQERL